MRTFRRSVLATIVLALVAASPAAAQTTTQPLTINVADGATAWYGDQLSPWGTCVGPDTCVVQYPDGLVGYMLATTGANFFDGEAVPISGCDNGGTGLLGFCTFLMDRARTIDVGVVDPDRTLDVSTDGTGGGWVSSAPSGIGCPINDDFLGGCSEDYLLGTLVTLTAHPNGRSTFGGWDGCDNARNNVARIAIALPLTCVVTMDSDRDVTATFDAIPGAGSTHSPGTLGSSTSGGSTTGGGSTSGGGASGGVAGNVYSDPSIELLSQTGLVKQFDLRLTCGTLACGGWPAGTLTLAGETIGTYTMQSGRLAAAGRSVVHMVTSKATRQKLRKARKAHPNARPRLWIAVTFGMANQKLVTKSLKLRLA